MGIRRAITALIAAMLMLGSVMVVPIQSAAAAEQCFPQTGLCVDGRFLDYWMEHGGLAINGYPITVPFSQILEDGKEYTVQYFERVRMEYHPENQPPYDVLLGQFGRALHPADPPVAERQGATYFAQTGHSVTPDFLVYWQANGGLAQFGFPITEEIQEQLEDGKLYTVQYFERARFERHPENQPPFTLLLGQFGRRILAQQSPTQPQRFQGSGQRVITGVRLKAGLVLVKSSYMGQGNFIAELKDRNAQYVGLLVNDIGTSISSTALAIPSDGTYTINVSFAQGPWTFELIQPSAAEFGNSVLLPRIFTGRGNQYTTFFVGREGALTVKGRQSGKSNFIAMIRDSRGEYVGLAVNVIGTADSSQVLRLPANGLYLLVIQADGEWTLDLSQ